MVQRLDIAYKKIDELKKGDKPDINELKRQVAALGGRISDHEKKIKALLARAKKIDASLRKVKALLESGT